MTQTTQGRKSGINADVDANVKTELQNRKLVLQSIVQRGWYF
jgi:hypothetical protein